MNLISSPIRKLKDIHTNRVTNYLEPLVLYTSPLYEKVLKEYFLQNGLFNVKWVIQLTLYVIYIKYVDYDQKKKKKNKKQA